MRQSVKASPGDSSPAASFAREKLSRFLNSVVKIIVINGKKLVSFVKTLMLWNKFNHRWHIEKHARRFSIWQSIVRIQAFVGPQGSYDYEL